MQPPRVLPAGHRVAVFDFEHTLFALRRFLREQVFDTLEPLGVSAKQFAAHYRALASTYQERLIPRGLCRRLAAECGASILQVEIAIAERLFSPAAREYLSHHIEQLIARARMSHDRLLLMCDGSEPYKQNWLRHIGIYRWFNPEEIILARSKRVALQQHLGPVSHVTMVSGYQRDAQDLAAVLNKRGAAVLPIVARHETLARAIDLL